MYGLSTHCSTSHKSFSTIYCGVPKRGAVGELLVVWPWGQWRFLCSWTLRIHDIINQIHIPMSGDNLCLPDAEIGSVKALRKREAFNNTHLRKRLRPSDPASYLQAEI